MKPSKHDVPLCLPLLLALSCACGGKHYCPTCNTPLPTPPPPGSRVELYGFGTPLKVGECGGYKINVPLRAPDRPDGPLSGIVDAEVRWNPASHVDAYLLDYGDRDASDAIRCDIHGATTNCPAGLSYDLDPIKNPKLLSYATSKAKDPAHALLMLCNRTVATTASFSMGFTPIL
jgi:hypothetical protein